jgi:hypothetical protein
MKPTFDRTRFLSAATELLEDVVPSGPLGLGDIPIRELTAAQRLEAVEVAKVIGADGEIVTLPDGSAKLDTAMYWAALIQMSVLDPNTCTWNGDTFVQGGALLLTPADIPELASKGREALQVLAQHIQNLSWLQKVHLFRSSKALDRGEPATGANASEPGNASKRKRGKNGNDGTPVGTGNVPDVGEPPADGE